jgi:carbonic anhydrase
MFLNAYALRAAAVFIISFTALTGCSMAPEHERLESRKAKAPASVTDSATATAPIIAVSNEAPKDGLKVIFDDAKADTATPAPEPVPLTKIDVPVPAVQTADASTEPNPTSAVEPTHAAPAKDLAPSTQASDLKVELRPITTKVEAAAQTKVTPALTSTKRTNQKQIAPETALVWLQHGNQRFAKNHLRNDGQSNADRARLASGQQPHTVILACSDSRVPPELVFDQKLGEVLVVRTAGESLDHAAVASIEDAVDRLGARLILVLGHESCDTVDAAVQTVQAPTKATATELSPAMAATLESIKNRFALTEFAKTRTVASTSDLAKASELNASGAAQDLLKQSEIVKRLVTDGQVQIHSAVYHMKSGLVTFH